MKHNRLTKTGFIVTLALCVTLLSGLENKALASRIVAIVNGAVITDLDIGQRQRLERLLSGGKKRLGRSAALNELIDDKLKLIEARDRKMTASDKEISAAMKNMASNVRMSEKRMLGVFRQAGISADTVKSWLKVQISWRGLVQARFNTQMRVEEADIARALLKKKDDTKKVEKTTRFDLTQVIFVTRKKASKREASQRLSEAKRFRGQFASCERDLASARRLKDVAVSRVGRRNSSDLPPDLAKRLNDTAINKLTAPVRVANGYEMLAVCGKEDLGTKATLRSEIETELRDERGKNLSRKYLRELQARAIIEKR